MYVTLPHLVPVAKRKMIKRLTTTIRISRFFLASAALSGLTGAALADQISGESEIDRLIRKYGYRTSEEVMKFVDEHPELQDNLSAAAHLIHGSSENRFTVTYCPGKLTQEEVEGVGYSYGNLEEMSKSYPIAELKDGWNERNGERFYYISNPALGLWAERSRF